MQEDNASIKWVWAKIKRGYKTMESWVAKIKCAQFNQYMWWADIDSDFDGEHCLTVKEMNEETVKCEGKCNRYKYIVVLKEEIE